MSKRTRRVRVAVGTKLQPVGEIVFEADGRRQSSMFRYAVEWLENPERFALSPALPLSGSPYFTSASRVDPRSALPGPIGDSSPDSWGRGLIQKARSAKLTELDYLLAVDDFSRQGSLRYLSDDERPLEHSYPPIPRLIELRRLRSLASAAERGLELTALDGERLFGSAGSLGGARPKASVLDDRGDLVIAKFTSDGDTMPTERAEVATLNLARAAGINAALATLELSDTNRPVALIKRFDRKRGERLSYLSAQSFLGLAPSASAFYSDIADTIRAHGAEPRRQMAELYRRILFTILVSNDDDHLKNHGLLHARGGLWVLSPAFDINPQPFRRRQLETGISDLSGNVASIEAAVEAGPFFGLTNDQSVQVLSRVVSTIDEQWTAHCRAAGMTDEQIRLYEPAFDNEESKVARRIGASRRS